MKALILLALFAVACEYESSYLTKFPSQYSPLYNKEGLKNVQLFTLFTQMLPQLTMMTRLLEAMSAERTLFPTRSP